MQQRPGAENRKVPHAEDIEGVSVRQCHGSPYIIRCPNNGRLLQDRWLGGDARLRQYYLHGVFPSRCADVASSHQRLRIK